MNFFEKCLFLFGVGLFCYAGVTSRLRYEKWESGEHRSTVRIGTTILSDITYTGRVYYVHVLEDYIKVTNGYCLVTIFVTNRDERYPRSRGW